MELILLAAILLLIILVSVVVSGVVSSKSRKSQSRCCWCLSTSSDSSRGVGFKDLDESDLPVQLRKETGRSGVRSYTWPWQNRRPSRHKPNRDRGADGSVIFSSNSLCLKVEKDTEEDIDDVFGDPSKILSLAGSHGERGSDLFSKDDMLSLHSVMTDFEEEVLKEVSALEDPEAGMSDPGKNMAESPASVAAQKPPLKVVGGIDMKVSPRAVTSDSLTNVAGSIISLSDMRPPSTDIGEGKITDLIFSGTSMSDSVKNDGGDLDFVAPQRPLSADLEENGTNDIEVFTESVKNGTGFQSMSDIQRSCSAEVREMSSSSEGELEGSNMDFVEDEDTVIREDRMDCVFWEGAKRDGQMGPGEMLPDVKETVLSISDDEQDEGPCESENNAMMMIQGGGNESWGMVHPRTGSTLMRYRCSMSREEILCCSSNASSLALESPWNIGNEELTPRPQHQRVSGLLQEELNTVHPLMLYRYSISLEELHFPSRPGSTTSEFHPLSFSYISEQNQRVPSFGLPGHLPLPSPGIPRNIYPLPSSATDDEEGSEVFFDALSSIGSARSSLAVPIDESLITPGIEENHPVRDVASRAFARRSMFYSLSAEGPTPQVRRCSSLQNLL